MQKENELKAPISIEPPYLSVRDLGNDVDDVLEVRDLFDIADPQLGEPAQYSHELY